MVWEEKTVFSIITIFLGVVLVQPLCFVWHALVFSHGFRCNRSCFWVLRMAVNAAKPFVVSSLCYWPAPLHQMAQSIRIRPKKLKFLCRIWRKIFGSDGKQGQPLTFGSVAGNNSALRSVLCYMCCTEYKGSWCHVWFSFVDDIWIVWLRWMNSDDFIGLFVILYGYLAVGVLFLLAAFVLACITSVNLKKNKTVELTLIM